MADTRRINRLKEFVRGESFTSCYNMLNAVHCQQKYLDNMNISDVKEEVVSGMASVYCGSHIFVRWIVNTFDIS